MDIPRINRQIAAPRVLQGDNPFQIPAAADYLLDPREDVPGWSETMFFMVWSPGEGVGLWLHMGVVPEDKTLWWAQVYAMLPDGVVLVDRSFGRTTDPAGPDTGNLSVKCTEPLRRWRLSFDGAGEISSTGALAGGLVGAGIAAPFSFLVELDAFAPVYDMHAATGAELDWNAGAIHHEQTFSARGELVTLGERFQFTDGVAVRDHSQGVRDFKEFNGWVWTHAMWPGSGRVLAGALMWRGGSSRWIGSVGMLYEAGRTEVIGDFQMTGLSAYGGYPRALTQRHIRGDGTEVTVEGEVLHNVTMTYAEPNHNLNGALLHPSQGRENHLVADESVMRWMWDGEVGYGHVERAARATELRVAEITLAALDDALGS